MGGPADIPLIRGNGQFAVNVTGTNAYRGNFDVLCGARRMQSVNIKTRATLMTQDDMVIVSIRGLQVGTLSNQEARAFDRTVRYGHLSAHDAFECFARICGGWSTFAGRDEDYKVHLDLNLQD